MLYEPTSVPSKLFLNLMSSRQVIMTGWNSLSWFLVTANSTLLQQLLTHFYKKKNNISVPSWRHCQANDGYSKIGRSVDLNT